MIRIGVIGYGYWGPNLVRNFDETPGASVACVSDLRRRTARSWSSVRYPAVKVTESHRELIDDPASTPSRSPPRCRTHFELALRALQAGKHVFVEKPLAATVGAGRSG